MTHEEARELQELGQRLASKKSWWGTDEPPEDTTVVRCVPHGRGQWSVRVSDAVGIVAIPSLQIVIEPKIPISHLLYLFAASGAFPRLDNQRVKASLGRSLFELVAEWYIAAMELVLRQGLIRDYHDLTNVTPFIRGRLDVPNAGRAYYAGRTDFLCHFEEFGFDTPLNRVLKAASRAVLGSQLLKPDLRRRAAGIVARLEDVGDLQTSDLRVRVERKTQHYSEPHLLALHVIRTLGRWLGHGAAGSRAFLIRTPEMIEEGLRKLLSERCQGWTIRKGQLALGSTSMTLNPDIIVDNGIAVADVKYKLAGSEWKRSDLYQVVTFAAGYRAPFAAIVDFRPPEVSPLPLVPVGDTSVIQLSWIADRSLEPDAVASTLAATFSDWLASVRAA